MLSAPVLLDSASRMLEEALGVRQRPEADGGRLKSGMTLGQRQRGVLGRGAHQAHPAGPACCARLGSPLLHLQQRTTLLKSVRKGDAFNAGSLLTRS